MQKGIRNFRPDKMVKWFQEKLARDAEAIDLGSSGGQGATKYARDKYLIKLTTETGKELIVTSEHKIAVKDFFNKIKYIAAENLKPWHKLITLE